VTPIVYLHGFRSSPASAKAQALQRAVDALPASLRPQLHVPELDAGPLAAIAGVRDWIERHATQLPAFIGSSLGGYYATHLAERYAARAVLVNPAVRPYDDLAPYIGQQTNLYTGRVFEVTAAHFDELRALATAHLAQPSRYLLYLQSGDEVLDWRAAAARYGGAWQCVEGGGDHGFTGFERHIPTLLRFAESGFGG
jgi:predicted esterase YcpF (UPF0227 family)